MSTCLNGDVAWWASILKNTFNYFKHCTKFGSVLAYNATSSFVCINSIGRISVFVRFKIFRVTVTKQWCYLTHLLHNSPLCFKQCYLSRLPKPIEDIAEVRRRRLFYHIFPGEPFLKSFFSTHPFKRNFLINFYHVFRLFFRCVRKK